MLVDGFIGEELKEKYAAPQVVDEYLEEVRHNVLDNLEPFKEREGEEEAAGGAPSEGPLKTPTSDHDPFRVYGVNVLACVGARTTRRTLRRSFSRPHRRIRTFSEPSSAVTTRAASGPPILWTFAAVRCSVPTAAT